MSKKKIPRKKSPSQKKKRWNDRRGVVVASLILSLSLAGIILAQWRSFRRAANTLPTPQTSQTPQLSKEYLYAGGRLLATEEPNIGGGPSPLSAPSGLTASGTATPTLQVNLSWAASTGGTVDHYMVERCQNFAPNCYAVVAQNVPANVPTINFSDTSVTNGSAYLYRVRAVDSSGNFSSYSSVDLATAISFADDPLQAGTILIKAQHVTELRQAINAVRALANLPAASWTNSAQAGSLIRAVDVQELRASLDAARSALGLAAASYTDQPLGAGTSLIKKNHVEELRQAVK